jgi:hypothetical protein
MKEIVENGSDSNCSFSEDASLVHDSVERLLWMTSPCEVVGTQELVKVTLIWLARRR